MVRFRLAVFNTQPPHLYSGGVERRIMETTKRLSNQADISVYCGTKAGFKAPIQINGVNIVPCHSTDRLYPLDNWSFNRSLPQTVGVFDADLYEAHNVSGYGFPNQLRKRNSKKPFIQVIHGPLKDEYLQALKNENQSARNRLANLFMRYLASLEKQTAKKSTLIVTESKYSMNKIMEHYGVDRAKIQVIPNGVDQEKYKPQSEKAVVRAQFRIGNEQCVLFVGSLIPRKGLPFLVEAAKKIVQQSDRTKFLIAGEGPLRTQIQTNLQAANLTGNFEFLGKVSEPQLQALYGCADVFALPSIQEGQGIVLLEAQASGVPVVAFDVGGVGEAVQNGETGFLAKLGNTNEFAEAILKLLSDQMLRERMGANGRRFVLENYTWNICAEKMLQVYCKVLGNL
jgi:glycosyltransferase involved in cell wall biosynthesis